jgi:HK97 family phage major capsid protein
MDKIKELIAKRQAELDAAKALRDKAAAENRDLTDEELSAVDGHLTKAGEFKTQIEAAQEADRKRQEALKRLAEEDAWGSQVQEHQRVRQTNPAHATGQTNVRVTCGEASGRWSCFGEWLAKVRGATMSPGNVDQRLLVLSERDQISDTAYRNLGPLAAASGLGVAVDADGGYLIPAEFRDVMVKQLFETGAVLSRVAKASLTGNTLKIPYVNETSRATGSRAGGVQGYWIDEGTSPTVSAPKFGRLELSVKKVAVAGYITEEMIADYGASSTLMMNAFRDELVWLVEDAIFNGTGVGQPLGILNADALIEITKESSQTAATVWGSNIVKMWARMPARSRANAVWFCNQDCETQLWGLGILSSGDSSTSDVIPFYSPAGSLLNQGQYGVLMGRPVVPVEYCQTLGTKGDIYLVDPTQYLFVDKMGGLQSASSVHVRFLYDEQTFRVTYRVDGQPLWNSAVTPANGSNTLSPFIALAVRS